MFEHMFTRKLQAFHAVACAVLTIAVPAAARADTFHVRFSVKLIGLPLGTAAVSGSVDSNAYQVDASARLTGVASMVSNSKGAATSSGSFAQGRVAPSAYATTSANSNMTRTVRMAMTGGTVKAAEITPPFDDTPGRVPVTDAHRRNIIDPLSALIMPVAAGEQISGPAACNRSIPIYDGWTRFDVNLTYVGSRMMKVKGYQGPVAVCAARYVPVAGHRPDRAATKFMEDNKQMEVWLAPVGGSRIVVPLRISVATMIGTTVIEAQEFETTSATTAAAR